MQKSTMYFAQVRNQKIDRQIYTGASSNFFRIQRDSLPVTNVHGGTAYILQK